MDPQTSTHHTTTTQDTRNSARSSVDMESAIPKTFGGSWDPCNLDEEILSLMEQEGLIEAKQISKWRVEPKTATPAPSKKEIVVLKSHIDRGRSLPPSYFLKSMLRHYRLQLHHIAPNSLTIIAGFIVLLQRIPGSLPLQRLVSFVFQHPPQPRPKWRSTQLWIHLICSS
jgi:hypothetical protein